jgi:hypothetical protein
VPELQFTAEKFRKRKVLKSGKFIGKQGEDKMYLKITARYMNIEFYNVQQVYAKNKINYCSLFHRLVALVPCSDISVS